MKCKSLGLMALVVLVASGCGDPVVFQPITDPVVRDGDRPRKDVIVRTFVGYCASGPGEYEGYRAPAVAVVTSGREPGRGRCQFVFFLDEMSVTVEFPIKGKLDVGRAEFQGKAWDPRGWDVHWTATLSGGMIEGTFKQPHDQGIIRLKEIK